MVLTATKAPPPLAVQFRTTTTLITLGATLTPTSFQTVYKRVTAWSNGTFAFDVTGGHAQTGTYTITTTQTTPVIFYGIAPTVTCTGCSTQTYNGYSEVLTFPAGLTSSPFTLVWTGVNLLCLCAIAETISPIGDLSPVVARELEQTLFWQPVNNATVTVGGTNPSSSWGFFLTTNRTLWQTNNQTWTPFLDPSVALFFQINLFASTHQYNSILYLQQRIGETLSQESVGNGCPAGSAFMCVIAQLPNLGATPAFSNYLLNYTGAGGGSGLGTTCPNAIAQGSTGCSSIEIEQFNPATIVFGSNTALPSLSITGQTYYAGFFLGANELGSSIRFCFDNGDGNANFACNNPVPFKQYYTAPGCTGSSMEVDYCIPTGCSGNNCVSTTTDSGGFFGSVGRFFSGVGNFVVQGATGIYNAIVAPIANGLGGLEGSLASAIGTAFQLISFALVVTLNAIGNFFGLGNIGTQIQSFFTGVTNWIVNVFGGIISSVAGLASFVTAGMGVLVSFFASNPIFTTITGFFGQLPALYSLLLTVWNDFVNGALTGLFSAQVILVGDWVYGIFETLFKGMKGFKEWLNTNELFALTIFKATKEIVFLSVWFLKAIKQMLTGWL
jgi:hypothetical protein